MTNFLYNELQRIAQEDGAPAREAGTIRSWLHGTTLGPQDPDVFYSIALATGNKTFEEWLDGARETATSSTGFWGAYKFYNTLRQTIMHYLARSKGELKEKVDTATDGKENGNGHKSAESFDMTAEIQIVLNQFMEEINGEFSLARVVGLERFSVPLATAREQRQEAHAKLANGAYTGEIRQDIKPVSLAEIINESNMFSGLLGYVFEDYVRGVVSGRYRSGTAVKEVIPLLKGEAVPQPLFNETGVLDNYMLYARFVKALITEIGADVGLLKHDKLLEGIPLGFITLNLVEKKGGKDVFRKVLTSLSNELEEAILSGEVDQQLKLPEHTVYRAFEHGFKLIRSMPQIHYTALQLHRMLLNPALDRKTIRETELELRKARQKLASRYGLSSGTKMFLLTDLLNGAFETYVSSIKNSEVSKMGWSIPEYHALLRQAINSFHDAEFVRTSPIIESLRKIRRGSNFTTEEVTHMLEQHGLTELYRLIPKANFVFDGAIDGAEEPDRPEKKTISLLET